MIGEDEVTQLLGRRHVKEKWTERCWERGPEEKKRGRGDLIHPPFAVPPNVRACSLLAPNLTLDLVPWLTSRWRTDFGQKGRRKLERFSHQVRDISCAHTIRQQRTVARAPLALDVFIKNEAGPFAKAYPFRSAILERNNRVVPVIGRG